MSTNVQIHPGSPLRRCVHCGATATTERRNRAGNWRPLCSRADCLRAEWQADCRAEVTA